MGVGVYEATGVSDGSEEPAVAVEVAVDVLVGGTAVGSTTFGLLHAASRLNPASLRKSRLEKCEDLFVMFCPGSKYNYLCLF